jgi:hypothetical protein
LLAEDSSQASCEDDSQVTRASNEIGDRQGVRKPDGRDHGLGVGKRSHPDPLILREQLTTYSKVSPIK